MEEWEGISTMPVKEATIQDMIDQLERLKEVYGDLPVVIRSIGITAPVMAHNVSMLWDVTQWEGQGVLKVG